MWHGGRLPNRTTGQSNEEPSALYILTTKVIELEDEVKRLHEGIEQAVELLNTKAMRKLLKGLIE
tara:strand:- start:789 stop:983 length:195 start_codon:yes stop_codon:yes gene_type:complete